MGPRALGNGQGTEQSQQEKSANEQRFKKASGGRC
jgi:hypothetical protein